MQDNCNITLFGMARHTGDKDLNFIAHEGHVCVGGGGAWGVRGYEGGGGGGGGGGGAVIRTQAFWLL